MTAKESGLEKVKQLVQRFNEQLPAYKKSDYNETQTRRDFIDPLFKALGWDIDNKQGYAESYREVIHEDKVKVGKATKAPDYSFRLAGGKRLFFVEAKKPSILIKDDIQPAYQVRRYGWSAKLNVSIITDFEEFAIYDCNRKPNPTDKSSVARVKYFTFTEYENEWDFLWETFSKEAVLKGTFDKFLAGTANKKGTASVDKEFLNSLDQWRTLLAESISKENKQLDEDELNFAVQQTLDRIIFLRICEDRSIEHYGSLQDCLKFGDYYQNLLSVFKQADDKYNSGLFDFKKDTLSHQLHINNKTIKSIINQLYYPESPYEFSVLSVEILGSAYEQFLGKTITINNRGKAEIALKPEVRKAGGVYYTPQYIVDYIVENTVGKLTENKTPKEVAEIKIVDPACGSGSFLLGAYQYLLNWHKDYYTKNTSKKNTLTPEGNLTTNEKKKILLNNIYGVDIDTNAVEVTKLSLLLKCMEGETQASIANQKTMFNERVLPTLENNIKSGNSLIDTDYYDNQIDFGEERKIKPFSWQKAFPSVFNRDVPIDKTLAYKKQYNKVLDLEKETNDFIDSIISEPEIEYNKKQNGGFDVVIGNPPYVKVSDKNIFDYFNTNYIHQDYQQDLYLLFLEKYKSLLVTSGKLGIIIPNTWLQSIKFRNIRKYLIEDYYWEKILTFKNRVFDAIVDTHVLVFQRNGYIKCNDTAIELYQNNKIQLLHTINQNVLQTNGDIINIISSVKEKLLFEKIKFNSKLISEIAELYNGIKPFEKNKGIPAQTLQTMIDKPFVSESKKLPTGKNWLPLMRGSLMNRYVNLWDNNYWVQYGEWLAAPRNPEIFKAEEKIIVRQTGDSIIATIIGKDIICRNNLHIVISNEINHKFLLGIINSKLSNFYYAQINPEKGEALAEVKKNHVEQLPIPKKYTKQAHDQIVNHVEQLLQLNKDLQSTTLETKKEQIKSKIEYFEDKINELVYQLYNITDEERKIIEAK